MRSAATLTLLAMMITGLHAGNTPERSAAFTGWNRFEEWSRDRNGRIDRLESPIVTNAPWTELVASWNVECPPGTGIQIETRAVFADHDSRYFTLGRWAAENGSYPRQSVPGQKDDDGEVQTDTLVLKHPATGVRVRLTLQANDQGQFPRLKFVGLSLSQPEPASPPLPPMRSAWGVSLPVPERSQAIYPEGVSAWCSPTSVSMIMAYWAAKLGRPELDIPVPEVVKEVNDPQWPGTGNWVFNTAFPGSFPGLRAYVARFTDLSELEEWVACGVPVAMSVSYDWLRGKPVRRPSDGHLVVCVGFTKEGEVIVNDPGTREHVQKTFPREDVQKAWTRSHQTVYLIYPEDWKIPANLRGHWFAEPPKP
jgi:hypothetical protein